MTKEYLEVDELLQWLDFTMREIDQCSEDGGTEYVELRGKPYRLSILPVE